MLLERFIQLRTKTAEEDLWPKELKLPQGSKGKMDNRKKCQLQDLKWEWNGVKFWYHGWFNSTPLHLSHQKASKPAVDKHAKVADLVHQGRWKLSLKRQPNVEEAQELV